MAPCTLTKYSVQYRSVLIELTSALLLEFQRYESLVGHGEPPLRATVFTNRCALPWHGASTNVILGRSASGVSMKERKGP